MFITFGIDLSTLKPKINFRQSIPNVSMYLCGTHNLCWMHGLSVIMYRQFFSQSQHRFSVKGSQLLCCQFLNFYINELFTLYLRPTYVFLYPHDHLMITILEKNENHFLKWFPFLKRDVTKILKNMRT